jgi:hypothetical protein
MMRREASDARPQGLFPPGIWEMGHGRRPWRTGQADVLDIVGRKVLGMEERPLCWPGRGSTIWNYWVGST